MATAILNTKSATVLASTAGLELELKADRDYTITHLGDNGAGSAATENVYHSVDSAPAALNTTADTNKGVLLAGMSKAIGPGVKSLFLKTVSGNVAVDVTPGPSYGVDF